MFSDGARCGILSGNPEDWPILGLRLKQRQERAILWANGTWAADDQPAQIWIREDAFLSEDALKLFWQKIRSQDPVDHPLYWNPIGDLGTLQERVCFGNVEPSFSGFQSRRVSRILRWPRRWIWNQVHAISDRGSQRTVWRGYDHDTINRLCGSPDTTLVLMLWANFVGLGPFLWREVGGRNPGWLFWRAVQAFFRARSF